MTEQEKLRGEEVRTDSRQIHVAKSTAPEEDPEFSGKAKKLMHRFTTEEVIKKMEEVESAK